MNILRIFNLLSLFLFLQISVSHAAVSVVSLQSKVDWSCVQFKITGVCVKAIYPYVGVRVSYNQPVLLVETVKKPGDSAITEYQPIVSSMTSAGGGLMSTAGGAISSGSSSTSNTDDTHTHNSMKPMFMGSRLNKPLTVWFLLNVPKMSRTTKARTMSVSWTRWSGGRGTLRR